MPPSVFQWERRSFRDREKPAARKNGVLDMPNRINDPADDAAEMTFGRAVVRLPEPRTEAP
jgi:hypothetical protein